MGLKCSIRCTNCGKNIVIKGGGLCRKQNKSLVCLKCGYKNSISIEKNGKILVA